MISKGNTHNNGAKLARYMTTGKEGERAELWELRGFETENIEDAFRNVHIMATGTRCEQPFFHVQVRNPKGEGMPREHWERAADRIESILGLKGQPRAIAFHIEERTGDQHMHVAWSRIDEDALKAKPLPFFKLRLKRVSRELEKELGLTIVTNEREGPIKYAPTRAQDQQARRLGVDANEVRNTIRACWDRSDCGRSFEAALAHEGLILALGDRRGLVVVDDAGGVNALGKRILGITTGEMRKRMADLDLNELPRVEQARAFIREFLREKQQEKAAPGKERTEGRVAETKPKREQRAGSREKEWPVSPPQPERKSPVLFNAAATEATRDERSENLTGPALKVWNAWRQTGSDQAIDAAVKADRTRQQVSLPVAGKEAFAAELDAKGITFARATKEEADRSQREADFARAVGNYSPRLKEGEIVIVSEPGNEYRREGEITKPRSRIHKLDQSLAEKFVKGLGNGDKLQGIDATTKASDQRAQQRAADWQAIRLARATNTKRRARPLPARAIAKAIVKGPLTVAGAPVKALGVVTTPALALNVISKPLELLGNVFEGLFAPKLTPEQIREGEIAARERQDQAEDKIDLSRYVADRERDRQQRDQEREAKRQRGDRER